MGIFSKLFGNKVPDHTNFAEGDIFYTQEQENKYAVFKLLKIDEQYSTFHLMVFKETTTLPTLENLNQLEIMAHHAPIDNKGFEHPKFVINQEVKDNELLGYFEYIKQTQNVDELAKYAKQFYQRAYKLTDEKKNHEAIEQYTKAIDLIPAFFEAIDNRAFCYMNLGQWEQAIEGFHQSLQVQNSLLATFSIGECYLRLNDYLNAKKFFELALEIDPNDANSIKFLAHTNQIINDAPEK